MVHISCHCSRETWIRLIIRQVNEFSLIFTAGNNINWNSRQHYLVRHARIEYPSIQGKHMPQLSNGLFAFDDK